MSLSPWNLGAALSLTPIHRRSHGSLYKSLARGEVDAEAGRDLQVAFRPREWPLIFAVDTSREGRARLAVDDVLALVHDDLSGPARAMAAAAAAWCTTSKAACHSC